MKTASQQKINDALFCLVFIKLHLFFLIFYRQPARHVTFGLFLVADGDCIFNFLIRQTPLL